MGKTCWRPHWLSRYNSNNNYDKAEIKKIPYLCYDYTNKIPGESVRLDNNVYNMIHEKKSKTT